MFNLGGTLLITSQLGEWELLNLIQEVTLSWKVLESLAMIIGPTTPSVCE